MATITEAAQKGQWFYIEESQPMKRERLAFFELLNGKLRSNERVDLVGTYLIAGAKALLTFTRHGHPDFVMTHKLPATRSMRPRSRCKPMAATERKPSVSQ